MNSQLMGRSPRDLNRSLVATDIKILTQIKTTRLMPPSLLLNLQKLTITPRSQKTSLSITALRGRLEWGSRTKPRIQNRQVTASRATKFLMMTKIYNKTTFNSKILIKMIKKAGQLKIKTTTTLRIKTKTTIFTRSIAVYIMPTSSSQTDSNSYWTRSRI